MTDVTAKPIAIPDTAAPVPPSLSARISTFIGEIARPSVLLMVGAAEAYAIWVAKDQTTINAGGLVLGALFAAKSVDVGIQAVQTAKVQTAQATASGTTS